MLNALFWLTGHGRMPCLCRPETSSYNNTLLVTQKAECKQKNDIQCVVQEVTEQHLQKHELSDVISMSPSNTLLSFAKLLSNIKLTQHSSSNTYSLISYYKILHNMHLHVQIIVRKPVLVRTQVSP